MEKYFTNFTFHMPTEVVFGKDVDMQLGKYVKKYGGTKVMICMDGNGFIKSSGLFDRLVKSLEDEGIEYVELEGIMPNPNLSKVYEGMEIAKKEGVDMLIGVGGGSTMDTAKTIAYGLVYDGDVWDFLDHKATPKASLPVGCVSTIAATGSENTGAVVIYDDINTHVKGSFMMKDIRPAFSLLNPELTYTVPAFQTGAGSSDILAHTLDTYLCYGTSYLGDKFGEGLMKTVIKYAPIAIKDPTNYEARAELMLCAPFSHNDTTRIGRIDTVPAGTSGASTHMLEEPVGNLFHSTHGAGIALVMVPWMQMILDKDETTIPKLAQFAYEVLGVEMDPLHPEETAQEGINRLRNWLDVLGMPRTLHELGKRDITEEDIDYLVDNCKFMREDEGGWFMAFGHLTKDDVRELFEGIK